jgi:CHASE2 domain-containing sensor protein
LSTVKAELKNFSYDAAVLDSCGRTGFLFVSPPGFIKKFFTRSALTGAALAVVCGLLLWGTPLGEPWETNSYDLLWRFGAHSPGDRVVLLQLNSEDRLNPERARGRHAELLKKLQADGALLTVFDILFEGRTSVEVDAQLASAMRQNGRVVLTAFITNQPAAETAENISLQMPHEMFLSAAGRYGVGKAEVPELHVVRRIWPRVALTYGETNYHSLGWAAAAACDAKLDATANNQWLRYYGRSGPGVRIRYDDAFTQTNGFFRDKVVFVGGWPQWPDQPDKPEDDKFSTPYTALTGRAIGGVEINATTFLNLVKGDWLRRPPAWCEFLLLGFTGFLIGGGLRLLKPLAALLVAIGIFFTVLCAFVSLSFYTNYWFPWLVIAGGQLPFALAWAWSTWTRHVIIFHERFPGYTPIGEPVGDGAYGKVWLVRDATGELQALKEVELAKFEDSSPYEREFRGIKNYKPISKLHPGLLHIEHVNRNEHDGYFYYVMELGDALDPGWQKGGRQFEPRDLRRACSQLADNCLPPRECFRVGIVLLEALNFLHERGLVHRDIKPANVIFVNGQPKLADVGLIRKAPPDGQGVTKVYTPGYEDFLGLGTKLADMYALAITLYVSSTGNKEGSFPRLPTLVSESPEFMRLNEIICRATANAAADRYASAAEMLAAFREAQADMDGGQTRQM